VGGKWAEKWAEKRENQWWRRADGAAGPPPPPPIGDPLSHRAIRRTKINGISACFSVCVLYSNRHAVRQGLMRLAKELRKKLKKRS